MTNILVIDDDQEITTMLETLLSCATCRVQTARNGLVGLRLLRECSFDVVITDIVMPESDGFEVIMEINRMQPRPLVIAMTGGTANLKREYLFGVTHAMCVRKVLYKPFSINELLEFIGDSIGPGHPLKVAVGSFCSYPEVPQNLGIPAVGLNLDDISENLMFLSSCFKTAE